MWHEMRKFNSKKSKINRQHHIATVQSAEYHGFTSATVSLKALA